MRQAAGNYRSSLKLKYDPQHCCCIARGYKSVTLSSCDMEHGEGQSEFCAVSAFCDEQKSIQFYIIKAGKHGLLFKEEEEGRQEAQDALETQHSNGDFIIAGGGGGGGVE